MNGLGFKVNDDQFIKSLKDLIIAQKQVFQQYGVFLPIFAYINAAFQEVIVDEQLWSRTKQRLWQKGETSGNFLEYVSMQKDCDDDSLLIKAIPHGPVCHTNQFTCFGEDEMVDIGSLLHRLEEIIRDRQQKMPEGSYTSKLFKEGTPRIAQKVGEEGVEVALAAVLGDKKRLTEESADLLFHLLVLFRQQEMTLEDVIKELRKRMKQ